MNITAVVSAVGEALPHIVPAGVRVRQVEDGLLVSTAAGDDLLPLGAAIEEGLANRDSEDEALKYAALQLLSDLQDIVTQLLAVPWPANRAAGTFEFATPQAEFRDGTLYLWYGDGPWRSSEHAGVSIALSRLL